MGEIEQTPGNPQGLPAWENIHSPSDVEDIAALQIVNHDANRCEAWMQSKLWSIRWLEADILYQSPPTAAVWEGTTVQMANVSKFTVATHINSLKGQATAGLFYEDPPFVLRPRGQTTEDGVRAISAVMSAQLTLMNFRREVELGFFQALLFGTTIWKWGWKQYTETRRKYVRAAQPIAVPMADGTVHYQETPESEEFEVEEKEETICYPWLENVDIRHVMVDPGCRVPDIREAKYVIHRMEMTYRDLIELKNDPFADYDLPSEEEIKEWFAPPMPVAGYGSHAEQYNQNTVFVHHAQTRFQKTTEDPLNEPLEILERVDRDKIITVINRVRVIRNEKNPFGKIFYFSVNWWNNQDAFWGNGLGRLLGGEQRVQQGLTNGMLDITTLVLHPTYLRATGANVPTQQIRQRVGGILDVNVRPGDDVRKAFGILEQPRIPMEIFQEIQASEARAESSSGANEMLTQGGMPSQGRTSMGRTATGAGGIMSAVANRLGSFVEDFTHQVYEPWLGEMHGLNLERLPIAVLKRVVREELSKDLKIGESLQPFNLDNYFGADVEKFEVLAGSHLAAKQQMAQALSLMMQLFTNPQTLQQMAEISEEYVEVKELLHMFHDVSGWKNYYDIVKKMSPEMLQRRQQNNPAVIAAQAKQQQQQSQFDQKSSLVDQDNMAKGAREVLRKAMEVGMTPEAVEGQPGAKGFGSVETA